MNDKLSIGKLSKLSGINSSAIRYYEQIGLLPTVERTPSGYRFYPQESINTLKFIQRSKRLGFSLEEIRQLLETINDPNGYTDDFLDIIYQRAIRIEKNLTSSLIQRHELGLFFQELSAQNLFENRSVDNKMLQVIIDRICNWDISIKPGKSLHHLLDSTGCHLSSNEGKRVLNSLQGKHFHIWQEGESCVILFVSNDPEVFLTLQNLASIERDCQIHQPIRIDVTQNEDGIHFAVTGDHAYLFARIFLEINS